MAHDNSPDITQEERIIEKHISNLNINQVILLLAYLYSKYGQLGSSGLFTAAARRIKELSAMTPLQFRRLLGYLLMLKWDQSPAVRLFERMQK